MIFGNLGSFEVDFMKGTISNTAKIVPLVQKYWLHGIVGAGILGGLGFGGFLFFNNLGKPAVIAQIGLKKGVEWAEEKIRDGSNYLDFQKLCEQSGGTSTWQPRGNSVSIPGTSCSDLSPAGEVKMRELFPEATPPSGM